MITYELPTGKQVYQDVTDDGRILITLHSLNTAGEPQANFVAEDLATLLPGYEVVSMQPRRFIVRSVNGKTLQQEDQGATDP